MKELVSAALHACFVSHTLEATAPHGTLNDACGRAVEEATSVRLGPNRAAALGRAIEDDLAVFDAPLEMDSITPPMRENLDDELTEVKSENAIDRITSQANPRTLERVPAGARFRVRFIMDVLCDEDAPLFRQLVQGLRLLEDDALGGGGSRGSGRVRLSNLKLIWRNREYYAAGAAEKELIAGADVAALQKLVTDSAMSFVKE